MTGRLTPDALEGWERTAGWRSGQLRRAGFPPDVAERLAADRRYDLHAALDLVDRGCPPAVAARILAPLDDEPRP